MDCWESQNQMHGPSLRHFMSAFLYEFVAITQLRLQSSLQNYNTSSDKNMILTSFLVYLVTVVYYPTCNILGFQAYHSYRLMQNLEIHF